MKSPNSGSGSQKFTRQFFLMSLWVKFKSCHLSKSHDATFPLSFRSRIQKLGKQISTKPRVLQTFPNPEHVNSLPYIIKLGPVGVSTEINVESISIERKVDAYSTEIDFSTTKIDGYCLSNSIFEGSTAGNTLRVVEKTCLDCQIKQKKPKQPSKKCIKGHETNFVLENNFPVPKLVFCRATQMHRV